MRRTLSPLRNGVAVASAAVFLTACGASADAGSGPSASPRDSANSSSETADPASPASQVGTQVVFVGDFETGDFHQWHQCQNRLFRDRCRDMQEEFYGMQVVDSDARQGRYAARFELRDGDHPPGGGGERAELAMYQEGLVREGAERWYEFSLKFDAAFPPVTGKYLTIMQWHGSDDAPPPMAVSVRDGGQLVLSGNSAQDPRMVIGDIARGQWVDYVIHAKFSQATGAGWAEVYRDGVLTVPRHPRTNMNSDFNYLKVGLYRDGKETSTAVLWADGFRVTAPETFRATTLDPP